MTVDRSSRICSITACMLCVPQLGVMWSAYASRFKSDQKRSPLCHKGALSSAERPAE